MKKMFFYAAVACVAFASCQKDKGLENPYEEENVTMEAIQFTMNSRFSVATRGTGAVGDTLNGQQNEWNGQKLNVYMFDKGTMTPAINLTAGDDVAYFANDTITAPNSNTSGDAEYVGTKYYTSNGKYDFFAYHADSAVTTTPKEVKEGDKVVSYAAPFTIDGTQDLMIAKAWLNSADSIAFAKGCGINYKQNAKGYIEFTTTEAADSFRTLSGKHVYSAYAARRNVQPRFAFKHYLTRLIFKAEAMEEGVANTMSIDSVKIFDAKTTGTMTVAALDASKLGVVFDDKVRGDLNLVSRNCDTLTIQKFTQKGEILRLGESLLVAPENSYEAAIYYSQIKPNGVDKNGNVKNDTIKNVYEATIKLNDNATKAFKAGYQYNVNVKVYDNKPIVLTVDLVAWEKGEDVNLDSEE